MTRRGVEDVVPRRLGERRESAAHDGGGGEHHATAHDSTGKRLHDSLHRQPTVALRERWRDVEDVRISALRVGSELVVLGRVIPRRRRTRSC
jgi:ribosomal protein L27